LRTDVIDYTSITGDAKKIREQRLKKSCVVGPQLAYGRLLNYIDKQLGKFLELEQGRAHTRTAQQSFRSLTCEF